MSWSEESGYANRISRGSCCWCCSRADARVCARRRWRSIGRARGYISTFISARAVIISGRALLDCAALSHREALLEPCIYASGPPSALDCCIWNYRPSSGGSINMHVISRLSPIPGPISSLSSRFRGICMPGVLVCVGKYLIWMLKLLFDRFGNKIDCLL